MRLREHCYSYCPDSDCQEKSLIIHNAYVRNTVRAFCVELMKSKAQWSLSRLGDSHRSGKWWWPFADPLWWVIRADHNTCKGGAMLVHPQINTAWLLPEPQVACFCSAVSQVLFSWWEWGVSEGWHPNTIGHQKVLRPAGCLRPKSVGLDWNRAAQKIGGIWIFHMSYSWFALF